MHPSPHIAHLPEGFPRCHPLKVRTRILRIAVIMLVAGFSISCAAQDKGYWRAASQAASSITGDITIANSRLYINFLGFPLAPIRTLTPEEAASAFDADINQGLTGRLYRVNVPASRHFSHHNTLCGSEDTEWLATFVSGNTLQVAFFSGSAQPVFTFEAMSNSMNHCGTFTYDR
ncbi:MAG TPA: hypothetical protein VFI20_08715 [Terracidiphilus sp.]|nr:hypothetical protein [Terracidiphilus sp.]